MGLELRHCCPQGLGTKEGVIIEILASRTKQQLQEIMKAYEEGEGSTRVDRGVGRGGGGRDFPGTDRNSSSLTSNHIGKGPFGDFSIHRA